MNRLQVILIRKFCLHNFFTLCEMFQGYLFSLYLMKGQEVAQKQYKKEKSCYPQKVSFLYLKSCCYVYHILFIIHFYLFVFFCSVILQSYLFPWETVTSLFHVLNSHNSSIIKFPQTKQPKQNIWRTVKQLRGSK